MKKKTFRSYAVASLKGFGFIILFCYFGFIINPQWASAGVLSSPLYFHWDEAFSPPFRVWIKALPFVLFTLVFMGSWGIIGLWLTKAKKAPPSSSIYKFFIGFSGFGFLWFMCSIVLAMGTRFIYDYQKFDAKIWQDPHSIDYLPYQKTARQRMVYDLTYNILPKSTLNEAKRLLGPSLEITGNWPQGVWACGTLGTPDLDYAIGQKHGMSPLGLSLLIWYDQSGNFECATVRESG
jgi:hypothetical protein